MGRIFCTVNEFCREHSISRSHFYALVKAGQGPTVQKVGRRSMISMESATAWRESLPTLRKRSIADPAEGRIGV